jgi:hypothetical protein
MPNRSARAFSACCSGVSSAVDADAVSVEATSAVDYGISEFPAKYGDGPTWSVALSGAEASDASDFGG